MTGLAGQRLSGVCVGDRQTHSRSYFCSPGGEAPRGTQRSVSTSAGLKEEERRRRVKEPQSDVGRSKEKCI